MKMLKQCYLVFAILTMCLALPACASGIDEIAGVAPGENAVQCIHLASVVDGLTVDAQGETSRLEFPSGVDLTTLTPELVTAIADLAERMGCANAAPDN